MFVSGRSSFSSIYILLAAADKFFKEINSWYDCRPNKVSIECQEPPVGEKDEEFGISIIYVAETGCNQPAGEVSCNHPAIDYEKHLKVPPIWQPLHNNNGCVCVGVQYQLVENQCTYYRWLPGITFRSLVSLLCRKSLIIYSDVYTMYNQEHIMCSWYNLIEPWNWCPAGLYILDYGHMALYTLHVSLHAKLIALCTISFTYLFISNVLGYHALMHALMYGGLFSLMGYTIQRHTYTGVRHTTVELNFNNNQTLKLLFNDYFSTLCHAVPSIEFLVDSFWARVVSRYVL